MRHLAYGRIVLDSSNFPQSSTTGKRETGLAVLEGNARVTASGKTIDGGKHNAIYIPRDSSVSVETDSRTDIAEFSSDVSVCHYPLQVVCGTRLHPANEPPA
jgi:ethanolamine utilization protein EutQ (cupin superfamily)